MGETEEIMKRDPESMPPVHSYGEDTTKEVALSSRADHMLLVNGGVIRAMTAVGRANKGSLEFCTLRESTEAPAKEDVQTVLLVHYMLLQFYALLQ